MTVTNGIPELSFVDVSPLPTIGRGKTKTNKVAAEKNSIEELLGIPKLPVKPGFKKRAPLQLDERAKELIHKVLKNTICT